MFYTLCSMVLCWPARFMEFPKYSFYLCHYYPQFYLFFYGFYLVLFGIQTDTQDQNVDNYVFWKMSRFVATCSTVTKISQKGFMAKMLDFWRSLLFLSDHSKIVLCCVSFPWHSTAGFMRFTNGWWLLISITTEGVIHDFYFQALINTRTSDDFLDWFEIQSMKDMSN